MSRESTLRHLADTRAYSGTAMFQAMVALLESLEAQYKDDLVTDGPERFQRHQYACQQVRALRMALTDPRGDLTPTI